MSLEFQKETSATALEEHSSQNALSTEAQQLRFAAARNEVPDKATRIDPIPPWKPDPPCNGPFDPFCRPDNPPMPWDPKPKPKHPPKKHG